MPDRSGSRIDHLNIAVPDLEKAAEFYTPVLASIGITKMLEIPALGAEQPAMTGYGWPEANPTSGWSTTDTSEPTCTWPSPWTTAKPSKRSTKQPSMQAHQR